MSSRNRFAKNKKAISEIVSYTLLIVISLALAGMVFAFLKLYVPKETAKCPDDVSLIVSDYSCSGGTIELTLANKGLFKVDAAYIRLGDPAQKIRDQINEDIYLRGEGRYWLNPGESFTSTYSLPSAVSSAGDYSLDVQPLVLINKRLILCEKALITQTVSCTS